MRHGILSTSISIGLLANAIAVASFAQYRLSAGKLDSDGLPTTSAQICLGATSKGKCYTPPSEKYAFGLEPEAHTVAKLNGKDLILFTATFSGGGSGTLTDFALLKEQNKGFINLLPVVQLTNQSEYRVWHLPRFSSLPVLVTADFVWGFQAKETHFAAHHFEINVYVFDAQSGRYLQRVHYVTAKKYSGLDDSESIQVLDPERPAILVKLQRLSD